MKARSTIRANPNHDRTKRWLQTLNGDDAQVLTHFPLLRFSMLFWDPGIKNSTIISDKSLSFLSSTQELQSFPLDKEITQYRNCKNTKML
jgi:hypothetical protein